MHAEHFLQEICMRVHVRAVSHTQTQGTDAMTGDSTLCIHVGRALHGVGIKHANITTVCRARVQGAGIVHALY